MGSYVVTGMLETVVAVKYTDGGTTDGKWKSQPSGTWPIGTTKIFEAENRDASAVPPAGWVKCVAADGTEFEFKFDDGYSKDNYCSASMSHVSGNYVLPVPEYPKGGKTWTVTYHIHSGASEGTPQTDQKTPLR